MSKLLKEYIQHLVVEALDEGKFEDAVKANPKLAPYLKKYFKGVQPKYLPWIIKTIKYFPKWEKDYSAEHIHNELLNLRKYLDDFERLTKQNKFKGEEKDINKYSWADLKQAIEAANISSGTELKKAAKANSKKLFEDENYLIVEPLSKEASIYYGKGTKWCVSAKRNNEFDYFGTDENKLMFVINKKSGDKDAISFEGKLYSIFDAQDNEYYINPHKDAFSYIVEKYPVYLQKIIEKLINKEIKDVKPSLQEALRKFDPATFEKYGDLKGMLLYARYYLPSMGKGSSREAFAYGGNKVLKVALNDKGLSQNTTEASVFADKATSPSIAKVFKQRSVGGQVFWLISEIGRPLTSEKEFSSLMGFDWKTYENVIFYFGKGKAGNDLKSASQFVRNLFEKNLKHFQSINKQSNVVYYTKRLEELQRVENSPFVAGIINAMKNHRLLYADLATVDHYGKNAAGKVILLDAGYTEDVWKQHYSTPSAQSADSEAGTKPAMPGGVAKPKQQQAQGSDVYLPSADTSAPATAPARARR